MDVAHTKQCCQTLVLMDARSDAQHDWESALSTQEKHEVLFQVHSVPVILHCICYYHLLEVLNTVVRIRQHKCIAYNECFQSLALRAA